MATLFFSYSHQDENLRDQLEIHLAGLQRQGLISSWHDRRITAGEIFGDAIDEHIGSADIILLLVSPDFIASDYCYEREMKRALEKHERGDARVIPVILRPCDWKELPFGKLLAAPKDGRPVTKWPNVDEAFQDVVAAIKGALQQHARKAPAPPARVPTGREAISTLPPRSSNLRIKKQFTDLEKDKFRHEGFEYIAHFFENSLQELANRNPGIQQSFRRIDANRFKAAAYRNGEKVCRGSASLGGSTMGSESIEYSMTDEPRHGGMKRSSAGQSRRGDDLFRSYGHAVLWKQQGQADLPGRSGAFLGTVYPTPSIVNKTATQFGSHPLSQPRTTISRMIGSFELSVRQRGSAVRRSSW